MWHRGVGKKQGGRKKAIFPACAIVEIASVLHSDTASGVPLGANFACSIVLKVTHRLKLDHIVHQWKHRKCVRRGLKVRHASYRFSATWLACLMKNQSGRTFEAPRGTVRPHDDTFITTSRRNHISTTFGTQSCGPKHTFHSRFSLVVDSEAVEGIHKWLVPRATQGTLCSRADFDEIEIESGGAMGESQSS